MLTAAPKIALIEHGACMFLICDSPSDTTLSLYVKEFLNFGVTDVVRVCEPSYSPDQVRGAGLDLHDLPFADGSPSPPLSVTASFLQLVDRRADEAKQIALANRSVGGENMIGDGEHVAKAIICVHCVAGLGRAPLLVALALIEMGMKQLDAVELIRSRRRGAFSTRQIAFINSYKPRGSLRRWAPGGAGLRAASAFAFRGAGTGMKETPAATVPLRRAISAAANSARRVIRVFRRTSGGDVKMNVITAN